MQKLVGNIVIENSKIEVIGSYKEEIDKNDSELIVNGSAIFLRQQVNYRNKGKGVTAII